MVVLTCDQVQRAVSSYMDADLRPELRLAVEQHVQKCRRCTAIYEGVSNVITLFGGGNVLELPAGFSSRLYQRLCGE